MDRIARLNPVSRVDHQQEVAADSKANRVAADLEGDLVVAWVLVEVEVVAARSTSPTFVASLFS